MSLLMQALKMAEQSRQTVPDSAQPAAEASSPHNQAEAAPEKSSNAAPTVDTSAAPAAMQLNPPPAASIVAFTDFPALSLAEMDESSLVLPKPASPSPPAMQSPSPPSDAGLELSLDDLLANSAEASTKIEPMLDLEASLPESALTLAEPGLETMQEVAFSATAAATPTTTPPARQMGASTFGKADKSAGRLGLGGLASSASGNSHAAELGSTTLMGLELADDYELGAAARSKETSLPPASSKPTPRDFAQSNPGLVDTSASTQTNASKGASATPDANGSGNVFSNLQNKILPGASPAPQQQAKSVFGAKKAKKPNTALLLTGLSATCALLIGTYFFLQNQNNTSSSFVRPLPGAGNPATPIVNLPPPAVAVPPSNLGTPIAPPITPPALANAGNVANAANGAPNTATNNASNNPAGAEANAGVNAAVNSLAKNASATPQAANLTPDASPRNAALERSNQLAANKPKLSLQDDSIHLSRSASRTQISPGLETAYRAYQQGDLSAAQQAYRAVIQQEPMNRDALLGLAATSMRLNNAPEAANLYLRLLEIDPNDPEATAALISMQQSDPQQAESRLKKILQQHPNSASLHFMLGNVFSQQERWADAQQSYFRAFTQAPTNADYVFNLAVSLDRLGQSKLALEYYQRSLNLASSTGSGFSGSAVQARMRELTATLSGN